MEYNSCSFELSLLRFHIHGHTTTPWKAFLFYTKHKIRNFKDGLILYVSRVIVDQVVVLWVTR